MLHVLICLLFFIRVCNLSQLTTTTDVDNYPEYPQGVDGTKMMEDFKAQAEKFDTDVRWGMVTKS